MLTIKNDETGIRQLYYINSKGRETKISVAVALTLWRAGIAQPSDSFTTKSLISGYY